MGRSRDGAALLTAALAAVAAACALAALGPRPAADVARGSEDAFATGLHRRELPAGGGPQRWTTGLATFTFRDLPTGRGLAMTVELREVRGPVVVVIDGVITGRLDPGLRAIASILPASDRRTRRVELRAETFQAGDGRALGARLGRVAVDWTSGRDLPPPGLLLELVLSAVAAFVAARIAGARAWTSSTAAIAVVACVAGLLWPSGVAHSPYAPRLCALVAAGCAVASLFARVVARRWPAAATAAFVALLAGWLVQVVAGTSPVMVTSDAVFHANKLAAVAAGDLFPLSVTQHARPFRFPYGVSFYALLAPLARAGLDTVALVRAGAAAAGLAATAALFLLALAQAGPAAAGLAAVLLQVLPGTFDVAYSYGNLSNAFGQDMTVLFFCWWAARAPGRWPVGGALLALAALAHFSSFVFAAALVLALLVADRGAGDLDRTRRWAAVLGLALTAVYYAHFAGLMASQVPRLLEGGGQGRGASTSAWDALRLQVTGAIGTPWAPLRTPGTWGLPALVLAWIGRPHPWKDGDYTRELAAYWLAGLALAMPAILSPLEVRYLYGLTAAVALSAGTGAAALDGAGGTRRLAARALVALQVALGVAAIAEALFARYRP